MMSNEELFAPSFRVSISEEEHKFSELFFECFPETKNTLV